MTAPDRPAPRDADDATDSSAARVVDAWCKLDHVGAFVAADHEVVESTRALRAVVTASLLEEPRPDERDLLHAFGAIGRAIAEGRGSPTLAATTVDSLLSALDEAAGRAHGFACAARSAVFESYVHALAATLHDEASLRWEYPACVVLLPDGSAAIAAGHPLADEEALAGWASRVGHGLSLRGVRRAVVSGPEKAVTAVLDALDLAGIEATSRGVGAPPRAAR